MEYVLSVSTVSGDPVPRILLCGLPSSGIYRFSACLSGIGEYVIGDRVLSALLGGDLSWRDSFGVVCADWECVGSWWADDMCWYTRGLWSYMVYLECAHRLGSIDLEEYQSLMDILGDKLNKTPLPDVIVFFSGGGGVLSELEVSVLRGGYGVWCCMMRSLGVELYIAPPMPEDSTYRESWAVDIWDDVCALPALTTKH